ncbi:hypothetical protein E4U43_003198 [Claviceps pusilla]|uniref:Arabinase n=1 Tax=Claviceps pusilla TaxID=123648 RepID=A0A9P7N5W3_9HYPO|nr:hypothetical protein E4U43_003198 [Claviceps pusilla]
MRLAPLLLSNLVALGSLISGTQAAATDLPPFKGYIFAYFTGNTVEGEKIYLAASKGNDALNWEELNGGRPILSSTKGTRGLRDPFIMRAHTGDKFYLIATDLSIGSGTTWGDAVHKGSRYLEIWESPDLITWSEQRHILVSPDTAGNTWAPEAYWDQELGCYIVFWASSLYDELDAGHKVNTYHRILYATTTDFVTFSEPKIWQDTGKARIDSTILQQGDVYYRFTKDEGSSTGCVDIIMESSRNLTAPVPQWKKMATCIGKAAGTGPVEGPTSFKANPSDANGSKFYLFVDEYSGRGYIPLETEDLEKPAWKVSPSYKLPRSPRHGTVMPVTETELNLVTKHYGSEGAK